MSLKNLALIAFAVMLCIGCIAAPALAKEEVVYVNLDAVGSVEGMYIVNIFTESESTDIVDYGPYTVVKNLVSRDAIQKTASYPDGDNQYTITFGPGRLYYQGNPVGLELPWDITITYLLDGMPIAPEQLAGKSGHITIGINITENPDGDNFFSKNYGMTASVTLDANTCYNINAPGAVVANSGSDALLTYTMLPGKNIEKVIDFDAVNFHMAAISMNGARLTLNVKSSDITSKDVDDLKKGVNDLVDGALALKNGADKVYLVAANTLTLSEENATIIIGTQSLASGTNTLLNNLIKLKTEVSDIEEKITREINEVIDPLSGDPTVSLHSFASSRNTDVERVQFVIRTEAIELPDKEIKQEEVKELNFFERILALFGLA